MRTLTPAEWDTLAGAIALADCEWEDDDPKRARAIIRVWDKLKAEGTRPKPRPRSGRA